MGCVLKFEGLLRFLGGECLRNILLFSELYIKCKK
nr:MAG TPA: hypothetical protein [Caudoviricetes sp.]